MISNIPLATYKVPLRKFQSESHFYYSNEHVQHGENDFGCENNNVNSSG